MTSRFSLARTATRLLGDVLRDSLRQAEGRRASRRSTSGGRPTPGSAPSAHPASDYPGDYSGAPTMTYAPKPDGKPDPGEIVWGWVPFEEDASQGKDRPVLLVGRDGGWLLALMLTSKDHDRDAEQERRAGRLWCDIGRGDWDPHHRPSEVRVNRVIRLSESAIRREGSVLPRAQFDLVADAVRAAYA
ncbi:MAG TPA: type II toxin-antitoxin system PemK/MazF family toxin [Flexivirga sp.]|uniref:type II toxin-antitoxin system PemK/MazF family toxin n=1 Tax=Flexivirga sp. TaxID=1962927 RepID=UPI002BF38CFD|nr:type II toxin-antitoxin system PemK/MazF family toxin [Flexivirga sp.]HWC24133.1 type II toxin-antitoxin system PemK/MazF family toxin [Flexivirga sp.]